MGTDTNKNKRLSVEAFSSFLNNICPDMHLEKDIAVACSGGPDSMALAWLCAHSFAEIDDLKIHVITVDHDLRPGSAQEAKDVRGWMHDWPHVRPAMLKWAHGGDTSRLQERARAARYELLEEYCKAHKISCLLLAHHQDDQAETVLMRLAKGSGLDGLSGMLPLQKTASGIVRVRPLLDVSKDELLELCARENIPYAEDPSNTKDRFARVRLRGARAVLEKEGLSAKRLSVTAKRLARARSALEEITEKTYRQALLEETKNRVALCMDTIRKSPEEIGFRTVLKVVECLRPEGLYLPRMEKLEALFEDILAQCPFRKRTLGGLVFERDDKNNRILLSVLPERK